MLIMVMKRILLALTCFIFFIYHASYAMPAQNPQALWRTYDLNGQARSVLKFYITDGELRADVVKILAKKGTYCEHCKGKLKNKPYLGMTIIHGLKLKNNKWIHGEVLDTDTGNTYSCNMTLSHDGETMHLHAYKGIPLFGRTVHWKREPVN
jgi:uncharacterized protein (DUF2147 family)